MGREEEKGGKEGRNGGGGTKRSRRQIILLSDGVQPYTHYFLLPKRQFISRQDIQIRLFQLPF